MVGVTPGRHVSTLATDGLRGRRSARFLCASFVSLSRDPRAVRQRFTRVALSPDPDLAIAALMIARLEYPDLDAGPYIDELDALGREAAVRVAVATPVPGDTPPRVDPRPTRASGA